MTDTETTTAASGAAVNTSDAAGPDPSSPATPAGTVPAAPPTAATVADTPLMDDELAQARRYMGYPAMGSQDSGMQSWRFFRVYGFNEWRLRNLAPAECAQARAFIMQCQMLEDAIMAATANLDTDRAAVWTRNRTEVTDRFTLYTRWRVQLCNFLGIPPGPGLRGMGEIVI
ncbi:hypothetical protein LU298_13595 [Komagataeibacter intermedius]|uniref:Uncharacterized protein n=2 Tax=Komagataeibacter intermedius TaxID=66229 RepID=A0A0N0MDX5_9PROT|nr:hypothetical protein [Komagataeibacter intermedius]KPH85803.1 hypothetical protein GLUCOINTEAF2_0201058 [Komagataeibacter intermedius AF2]MCF3637524.1 hypothetical protein [Komagataeibacter intermedius]GAN86141.1 hypothetical protein Gain_0015_029 [Komagataeibacter intermedius TF2]GBQ79198.1 hypothetical protein AA0521_3382 [Komagataeibacter intermedius NRIC 0521]